VSSQQALARLLPVLLLIGFWGYCLWDFVRTPPDEVRTWPREVWLVVLVLLNVLGGALWLAMGRPHRRG